MGTLNVNNINGAQLGGFRNLIINGNFQVNQRGAASTTATSSAYNYDRWYYDGTYLYQGVEDKSVANGTYTLSWVDAGSNITAEYVVSTDTTAGDGPDSGLTGWTTVSNGGNITVNEGTEYSKHLWVRFGGTLSNLSKVQLEHGTQATPFEHRPYGVELALCQRYYYRSQTLSGVAGAIIFHAYSTTEAWGGKSFPVTMRSAPTVTLYNNAGTSGGVHRIGGPDLTSVSAAQISIDGFSQITHASGFIADDIYGCTYTADTEL